MQIKKIKAKDNVILLCVKVPNDSQTYHIDWKFLIIDLLSEQQKMVPIPSGIWVKVNLLDEITEEQCVDLVKPLFTQEEIHQDGRYHYELDVKPMPYLNYMWNSEKDDGSNFSSCVSAKASFLSLMELNDIYSVNPMSDPEKTLKQGNGFTYYMADDEDFAEYARIEENVGKWLILRK